MSATRHAIHALVCFVDKGEAPGDDDDEAKRDESTCVFHYESPPDTGTAPGQAGFIESLYCGWVQQLGSETKEFRLHDDASRSKRRLRKSKKGKRRTKS